MFEVLAEKLRGKKILIMGVGNTLRGDDAVGPLLIERLQGKTSAHLLDAGDVPENYLGVIESACPQVILVIDAVDLGTFPGATALVSLDQLTASSLSTHSASLGLLFKALQLFPPPEVFILAVQPASLEFGALLSKPVSDSVDALEQILVTMGG